MQKNIENKLYNRFLSLKNSVKSLKEAEKRDKEDSFFLFGTRGKFCITFELAWKVMKDILIEHYAITNFVTESPKETLKMAFKAGLIDDDKWLQMLSLRNNLSHDYDDSLIKQAFDDIIKIYIPLFCEFVSEVEKLFNSEELQN